MALRKNVELETGIKVNGAYLRVEIPSLTKDILSFVPIKYMPNGVLVCSDDK